jgi:hypothetical protein
VRSAFVAIGIWLASSSSFAGSSSSSIQVGIIITKSPTPPLVGIWDTEAAVKKDIYHLEISSALGLSYQVISAPSQEATLTAMTETVNSIPDIVGCDIRFTGTIDALERAPSKIVHYFSDHKYLKPDYVVRYSVETAELLDSPANPDNCAQLVAKYESDISAARIVRSLFLSKSVRGGLIDSVAGTVYARMDR